MFLVFQIAAFCAKGKTLTAIATESGTLKKPTQAFKLVQKICYFTQIARNSDV